MCLTLFSCEAGYTEIFFLIWAKWIFLWVHLDRQKKKRVFLCVYFFFLCGLTHRKISLNLGERNFSVHVTPTEKLFLTTNTQNNWIFLLLYFCGYFSDGIHIFLCVFAHTEECEFLEVKVTRKKSPRMKYYMNNKLDISILVTVGQTMHGAPFTTTVYVGIWN